jgi:intracellular septation protein A
VGFAFARYRRPFILDGTSAEVLVRAEVDGLHSELRVAGMSQAVDFTPAMGPDATRTHRLSGVLPNGETFEVDAGYINWVNVGIAVRCGGVLEHESHPGLTIAYPKSAVKLVSDPGADMSRYKANKVPIIVDISLGLLFFLVAKFSDLSTAAIVGAAAGIALVVIQRLVKVDLTGGLALFGVFLLLISAGLAIVFQDDMAIKMRGTIVGSISAALFLGDGLLGGNRLGRALIRYLPYNDLIPSRLALGIGVLGLIMAGLNYAVAKLASTDVWLFYTTFVDFFLVIVMILIVFSFARGKLLPPKSPSR